jgi:Protein of unknown function (DUF2029).
MKTSGLFLFSVIALSGVLAYLYHAYELIFTPSLLFYDFNVYYYHAVEWLHGGSLYSTVSGFYLYTPISSVTFMPFTILSSWDAGIVFLFINVISIVILWWIILKILACYNVIIPARSSLLLLAAMFLWRPSNHNLAAGQVNIIIAVLLALAYLYYIKGRQGWSALALSTAVLIKIMPLPLILNDLTNRKSNHLVFIGLFSAFCALFIGAGLLIFGIGEHSLFLNMASKYASVNVPTYDFFHPNFPSWPVDSYGSISGLLIRILAVAGISWPAIASIGWLAIEAAAFICLTIFLYRGPQRSEWMAAGYCSTVALLLVVWTISHPTYGVFLILPLTLLYYVTGLHGLERPLFGFGVICLSLWEHILYLGHFIDGPVKSLLYIFNPVTFGYVSILAVTILVLLRLKKQYAVKNVYPSVVSAGQECQDCAGHARTN